jgi:hypothetical protein
MNYRTAVKKTRQQPFSPRLNFRLDNTTHCPVIRKIFGVLAEGLFSRKSRGVRTPIELFLKGAAAIETDIRCLIVLFVRHS